MLTMLYAIGSGLALFLAGANIAFLINLGRDLTGWFTVKICAITLLMAYMSMSLYIGNPGPWRASLGIAALLADAFALFYMWYSIEKLRVAGVTGMIPIARIGDER